jgi:methionyl aminopeptidase
MIHYKSDRQVAAIQKSNIIIAETFEFIEKIIEPGVDTETLNREIENFILAKNAKPAFKGLYGFPAAACISVNDEVVHGIPGKRALTEGDIVGIDIGVNKGGYFGDSARTFKIGKIHSKVEKLCKVTEECLKLAIEKCEVGNRIGDISFAIQAHAEKNGFSVVRDLVGHGVGLKPHEDPQVPNFGKAGKGAKLKKGMVLALEPMINMGGYQVYTAEDQWTVKTADGFPSAHYEHSVAITNDGPKILSKLM